MKYVFICFVVYSPDVIQVFKENLSSLFMLYENLLNKERSDIQLEAVGALTFLISSTLCSSPDRRDQFLEYLIKKSITVNDLALR